MCQAPVRLGQWPVISAARVGDGVWFRFELNGPLLTTTSPDSPSADVQLFWANGTGTSDIVGDAIATAPIIYWATTAGSVE